MIPFGVIHDPVDADSISLPLKQVDLPVNYTGYAYSDNEIVSGETVLTLEHAEVDNADYTFKGGYNSGGGETYEITLIQYRLNDFIVAGIPMTVLASDNIEIAWLFEIDSTYYWSTQAITVNSQAYQAKIDPDSFDGISISRSYDGLERIHIVEDVVIRVPDPDGDHTTDTFVGKSAIIKIWAADDSTSGVQRTFKMRVKASKRIYSVVTLTLEDAAIDELDKLFPTTELINNVWSSDKDTETGMCFPESFGTAYIPLPTCYVTEYSARYYILGLKESLETFAITEVQSPRSWSKSVWSSVDYTFDQTSTTTPDTYRIFQALIADSNGDGTADANGLFPSGQHFLPLPTKYSCSDTETLTDPESVIADLLFAGTSLTIGKTEYTLSPTFEGAFAYKKTRAEWLSMLLKMAHASFAIKDNGDRKIDSLTKASVLAADIDSDDIKRKTFSYDEILSNNPNDGAFFQFPKVGDPQNVLYKFKVGLGDSASTNPKESSLNLQFVDDSQEAQKLASLYWERKVDKDANLSFSGRPKLLCLNPDEVITISGSPYDAATAYDVVVSHVHIPGNLVTRIKCEKFGHDLHDYADLSPSAFTITEDTTEGSWNEVVTNTSDGSVDTDVGGSLNVTWSNIVGDKPEQDADKTDAKNVGSTIHNATDKTTLVSSDELGLIDTESNNALANVTLSNLQGYFQNSDFLAYIATHALMGVSLSDGEAAGLVDSVTIDSNGFGFAAALYVASDGHYEEAKADASGTLRCAALAIETGTGTKKVLRYGKIKNTGWSWTVGALLFLSASTAGGLTETAPSTSGQYVQAVGEAIASDTIMFNPSYDAVKIA